MEYNNRRRSSCFYFTGFFTGQKPCIQGRQGRCSHNRRITGCGNRSFVIRPGQQIRLAREEDEKKDNDKNDDPPVPPKGMVKYKKKTGEPDDKAQRNFTDPESRIMMNSDKAFVQAYNAQAVVDSKSQIILAAEVTNQAADGSQRQDTGGPAAARPNETETKDKGRMGKIRLTEASS
ncbi:MAG: hypothetical protein ACOY31_08550 [Bacillota bacterium]